MPTPLTVTQMPLADLVLDPENARLHPDKNLDAICGSLEAFGQREPLVVQRGSNRVIGGNGRLAAMRSLGWPEATVTFVDCSDMEATALGLALNRTAETAKWDTVRLDELLERCRGEGMDTESFGFDAKALDQIIARAQRDTDADTASQEPVIEHVAAHEVVDDDPPEPPKDPITKPGDTFRLGRHTVHCGDSTDHIAGVEQYDIVFTDPPYGVSYSSRVDESRRKGWGGIKNDDLQGNDLVELVQKAVPEAPFRFICCDWNCYAAFEIALGKPKAVCVWDKGHFGLGKGYRRQHEFVMFYGTLNRTDLSDMWPFKRAQDYQHPTQKPVPLVAKALTDVGKPGARVYDPFGGSGSTLMAAEQVGMTATLVEFEPKYVDVICSRWERLTGLKRELVRDEAD